MSDGHSSSNGTADSALMAGSVFDEFQRMWTQRFPKSPLSDAWEPDVRASLLRHRQRIAELTRELAQEQLYVEYLERLLSDVDRQRGVEQQQQQKSSEPLEITKSASVSSASSGNSTDTRPASCDGQPASQTNGATDEAVVPTPLAADKNPALQQCISELSTNLRSKTELDQRGRTTFGTPINVSSSSSNAASSVSTTSVTNSTPAPSATGSPPTTGSHFVTVIEVKESSSSQSAGQPTTTTTTSSCASDGLTSTGNLTEKFVSEPLAAVLDAKKKIPPRPPPKFIRRAAPVEPPTVPHLPVAAAAPAADQPEPNAAAVASLERNLKPSEILRQKSSDSLDVKLGGGGTASAFSSHRSTNPDAGRQFDGLLADELGRKLVSKAESLDRQRRPEAFKRTASPTIDLSASPTGSLHKTGSTASPNGSLSKIVTVAGGRLNSGGDASSRESLSSSIGPSVPMSERIKSYESISSISSTTAAAATAVSGSASATPPPPTSSTLAGTSLSSTSSSSGNNNYTDHEPFYDTVPLDNCPAVDGEYVYIQAGGTSAGHTSVGSRASSRDDLSSAGSTLPATHRLIPPSHPRSFSSQTSILTEPESPGRSANYMNIDYFLGHANEARNSSMDSDGESDAPPLMRTISHEDAAGPPTSTPSAVRRQRIVGGDSGAASTRTIAIRNICTSIIGSESSYVDCLNKMLQYMKAIRATVETSQPVITKDEFDTMFYKINELFDLHTEFLRQLRAKMSVAETADIFVGEIFRQLAEHIDVYGAFLHNYQRAKETVKKCGSNNQQFKDIVSRIVVNSQNEQSLSLEDLLHKPVARVQKNALVLQDLLTQTPATHADYAPIRHAHKMFKNFLDELNIVPTRNTGSGGGQSDDRAQLMRRLVKNSFIVELADNHRKLRHLFLFNDVIACAKHKAGNRDAFDYDLKWFIPLRDIIVLEESSTDVKEQSPVNILQLKSQACTVRDQLMLEQREAAATTGGGDDRKQRSVGEKHRKKLHDLESQLVLASPNLVLRISNRATGKIATFFLSSDYERTLWIDNIIQLQQSSILPGTAPPIQILDLQAWIVACQRLRPYEMGSYLMRSVRDESLLIGDLQLTVQTLSGWPNASSDLFVCVEVDSFGHYFRKARTKMVCRSIAPAWNETFVLELEGSQNVRLLLYEDKALRPILCAKHVLQLSRGWLMQKDDQENGTPVQRTLRLTDTLQLSVQVRFIPGEVSLRRVPTSKPGALFGAKMQQVLKREKRPFPFILSACIREVERRGMYEVGIYRVSGSASDLARLKKSFETNNYEAEQMLKEVDIHSVTGILKSYLRDLPEALFTDVLYPKLFEVFNSTSQDGERTEALAQIFAVLPEANRAAIEYILAHLIRVHQQEAENKMSLHNLAMVFGPTLLRPGPNATKHKDLLESSTVDVMAQAGILYCFLQARSK